MFSRRKVGGEKTRNDLKKPKKKKKTLPQNPRAHRHTWASTKPEPCRLLITSITAPWSKLERAAQSPESTMAACDCRCNNNASSIPIAVAAIAAHSLLPHSSSRCPLKKPQPILGYPLDTRLMTGWDPSGQSRRWYALPSYPDTHFSLLTIHQLTTDFIETIFVIFQWKFWGFFGFFNIKFKKI